MEMGNFQIWKPRVLARLAVLVGIFPVLVLEFSMLDFMTKKFTAGECPLAVYLFSLVLQVAILGGFGFLACYVWRPQLQGKDN